MDLSFLDKTSPAPQSLVHPPSDSYMARSPYTISHLLGLDILSLSTNQNDAFYPVLVVLASPSKVPQSKVFISKALAQTSSVFLALDRALKSNLLHIRCFKETEDRI